MTNPPSLESLIAAAEADWQRYLSRKPNRLDRVEPPPSIIVIDNKLVAVRSLLTGRFHRYEEPTQTMNGANT